MLDCARAGGHSSACVAVDEIVARTSHVPFSRQNALANFERLEVAHGTQVALR